LLEGEVEKMNLRQSNVGGVVGVNVSHPCSSELALYFAADWSVGPVSDDILSLTNVHQHPITVIDDITVGTKNASSVWITDV